MTYYLAILVHNQQLICLFLPFMSFLSNVWSVFEALRRTRITVNSGEQSHFAAENTTICLTVLRNGSTFWKYTFSFFHILRCDDYLWFYDSFFGLCKDTMVKKIYSCGDKTPRPPRNSFYISVDVWITQTKMQDIKPASFMLSYWMRLMLI